LSLIGLPVEFGQRLRRNQKNYGMRPVINCIRQLNLGSAFGKTWRISDIHGRIGTRLVINIISPWNLGSASGITWWIVDACGRIGTRLVINCVCLWNLGSASGVTCKIVDACGQIGMVLVINLNNCGWWMHHPAPCLPHLPVHVLLIG